MIKKWLISTAVILVILSATFGLLTSFVISRFSIFGILFAFTPISIEAPELNVLVLGIDGNGVSGRSDTIMVAHIDPKWKTVNIVAIPRDTLVEIPGVGLDKINHAFAFGGAELSCASASNFLKIPVKVYIKVSTEGLKSIIDSVGGIDINVDEKMHYTDRSQDLYIDLEPGLRHLNGREAVGFMRFRHDAAGDFGRIRRQQEFMTDLLKQLSASKNGFQIYQLLSSLIRYVNTNMSFSQITGLASVVREAYENDQMHLTHIPGEDKRINGIYYMIPDMAKTTDIVNSYLRTNINN